MLLSVSSTCFNKNQNQNLKSESKKDFDFGSEMRIYKMHFIHKNPK